MKGFLKPIVINWHDAETPSSKIYILVKHMFSDKQMVSFVIQSGQVFDDGAIPVVMLI